MSVENHVEEKESLPPRSRLHATEYGKRTRRFYAWLVVLFALMIPFWIVWFGWWKGHLPG